MKLKNVLMILLTLALVFSMAGSVAAAANKEIHQDSVSKTEYTEVIFSHQSQTYLVTIPAEINLAEYNVAVISEVNATNVVLNSNHVLIVKAKSQNGWNLVEKDDPTLKFAYTMKYNKNNAGGLVLADYPANEEFEILTVETGEGSGKTPLEFMRTSIPPETGTYGDMIYFSVSIVDLS